MNRASANPPHDSYWVVPGRLRDARETVGLLRAAIASDETVLVHCHGGAGRTGTIVGCLLVEEGAPAGAAVERLNALRGRTERGDRLSPETEDQRTFIERWTANGDR